MFKSFGGQEILTMTEGSTKEEVVRRGRRRKRLPIIRYGEARRRKNKEEGKTPRDCGRGDYLSLGAAWFRSKG